MSGAWSDDLDGKVAALIAALPEFGFDAEEREWVTDLLQPIFRRKQYERERSKWLASLKAFSDRALTHANCCGLHRSQVEFLQRGRIFYWDGSGRPSDPYTGERYLKIWQRIKDHYGSAEEGTFEWNIAEHDRDNRERRGHLLEVITREKLVEPPTIFDGLASERRRA